MAKSRRPTGVVRSIPPRIFRISSSDGPRERQSLYFRILGTAWERSRSGVSRLRQKRKKVRKNAWTLPGSAALPSRSASQRMAGSSLGDSFTRRSRAAPSPQCVKEGNQILPVALDRSLGQVALHLQVAEVFFRKPLFLWKVLRRGRVKPLRFKVVQDGPNSPRCSKPPPPRLVFAPAAWRSAFGEKTLREVSLDLPAILDARSFEIAVEVGHLPKPPMKRRPGESLGTKPLGEPVELRTQRWRAEQDRNAWARNKKHLRGP